MSNNIISQNPILQMLSTKGTVYYYNCEPISNSLQSGGWRNCMQQLTTDVLPVGTYLFKLDVWISSSQSAPSVCSFKLLIDGVDSDDNRQSIPTANAVLSRTSI